ncbi:maleylpyruvate isomerase family mycothiol-dependent enzyme [Rhodococcus aerolatus]
MSLGHEAACRAVIDETALLLDSADDAGWDAPVPSCPGWTVTDLVVHLGGGQRRVAELVRRGSPTPVDPDEVADTDPDRDPTALRAWLTAGAAELHQVLAEAGEDRPVWSFGTDATAMFWARRMAHEAVVHRMDAQLAAGGPVAVTCSTPELHADGISEALELQTGARSPEETAGVGQSLHVHATDTSLGEDGEWLLRRTPDGATLSHGHEKADVALRGPVHLLQAVLARRVGADDDRVEVLGDRQVLDDWLEISAF